MTKDLGDKVKQGVLWTSLSWSLRYVVRFGSHIVIARLLFPEDFGLMGVALILVQFGRRVSDLGFNQALVQLKKVKSEHYDTIFIVNIALALLMTSIILFSSPFLADFFKDKRLSPIFMVVSFDFILRSLGNIPRTILVRKMKFKQVGISDAVSNSVQLISPIVLALLGFGVWSLVWGNILGSATAALILFYFGKWYPKFRFRIWAIKDVFSFGAWTSVGKYLTFFINNSDKFIIAKFLDIEQMGYYGRGLNLLSIPRAQITRNLNRVLFSAYSKIQDDNARTIKGLSKVLNYLAFLLYPVMTGVYFLAPSFISVLYGPRWGPTTGPLQLLCFSTVVYPLARLLYPILGARGWVRQRALIQLVHLIFFLSCLVIGLKWGMNGIALTVSACSPFLLILIVFYLKKKIHFTFGTFFQTQKSAIIYSTVQILFLIFFQYIINPYYPRDSWPMLFLIPIVSMISLIVAHVVFRFKDVEDIIDTIKWRIKKKRQAKTDPNEPRHDKTS